MKCPRGNSPRQLLEEGLPQFEQFIESRESYIKALEQTIQVLKQENASVNSNNLAITSSVDELVAMQRLSNMISTALEPEQIVGALIELTRQVIPVIESNIFLFEGKTNKAHSALLQGLFPPATGGAAADRGGDRGLGDRRKEDGGHPGPRAHGGREQAAGTLSLFRCSCAARGSEST